MRIMRRPTGVSIMHGGSLLMAAGLLTMGVAGPEGFSGTQGAGGLATLLIASGCGLFVLGGYLERYAERHRR